jgi:hypothetical protein
MRVENRGQAPISYQPLPPPPPPPPPLLPPLLPPLSLLSELPELLLGGLEALEIVSLIWERPLAKPPVPSLLLSEL